MVFNGRAAYRLRVCDAQKKAGKSFDLTKFHDQFMNSGLVPVSIIRREMGVEGSAL